MSTALHPVKLDRHLTADPVPSLDDLAATANREAALAIAAMRATLEHALACGEALLAAREQVPAGEWSAWLAKNFLKADTTAHRFMRVAMHRDQIPTNVSTITAAEQALRGLPRSNGRVWCTDADTVALALRDYHAGGMTLDQVGERYGVTGSTVHYWLNRKKRLSRDKAGRDALRQRERDASIRRIGGSVAEGYSMVRRTAQVLDRAADEATMPEVRQALSRALAKLHAVEDEIVLALGVA